MEILQEFSTHPNNEIMEIVVFFIQLLFDYFFSPHSHTHTHMRKTFIYYLFEHNWHPNQMNYEILTLFKYLMWYCNMLNHFQIKRNETFVCTSISITQTHTLIRQIFSTICLLTTNSMQVI